MDRAGSRISLTAGVQAALLAERDQLLDDRTQVLRLGQRGRDLLVLDQRAGQIDEHRLAMARRCGGTSGRDYRDA